MARTHKISQEEALRTQQHLTVYVYPATEMRFTKQPTAVEGLSAIKCYEYQTCEHPEWEQSAAHAFCDALRDLLIGCLPGYEAAPWTWTEAMRPKLGKLPTRII